MIFSYKRKHMAQEIAYIVEMVLLYRVQRGKGDRPSRLTARPRGGVRSYALP